MGRRLLFSQDDACLFPSGSVPPFGEAQGTPSEVEGRLSPSGDRPLRHPSNALTSSINTSAVTEMTVSMTVQVRSVCVTLMPRYSFTSQKPLSFT